MEPPWKDIKEIEKGKYIASCDEDAIHRLFVKKPKKRDILQLEYLPQPYMGNPKTADIFLLNGNPNADKEGNHIEFNKKHKETILASYEHNCPIYALNSGFEEFFIYQWWEEHLCRLIRETSIETISKKIFVAEYFPYFSDHFNDVNNIEVPSQQYTFNLVEKAIKKKKMIVIMRAQREWLKKIIEWERDDIIVLNNYQNPTVSRGNMNKDKDYFNTIVTRLKNK